MLNIRLVLGILVVVFIVFLIYYQVKEGYNQNDPMLDELRKKLNNFFSNTKFTGDLSSLNNNNIMSKLKFYKGNKSYTINKRKVYLCLKDEDDEYYDINMLTYVSLHEIAHCICDEIGHTSKFHKIFDDLLKEAAINKIFDPTKKLIDNYCEYNE
jgi:hypothetical protein